MNLTTHWALALALGIGFFHNLEVALVMSIGSLIPDLDREYLFVARDFIGKHQLHRSLFHNFFFIALLYFLNPFLSLGALSHTLLDMFTSATDRGAETMFPITRIVRNFYHTIDDPTPVTQEKTTLWWVEDPWRLVKNTSDRELQEPPNQPWRRSYGPFKNSRVVDWGIFFGSLIFLPISYFGSNGSLYSLSGFSPLSLLPLVGITIFYGLGEWWRRKLVNKLANKEVVETNPLVLGLLIIGLVIFFVGGYLSIWSPATITNLPLLAYGIVSALIGFVASYALVKMRKKYLDLSL